MAQRSGLTVRQHERSDIELEVDFAIAMEHREQVRFSSMSSAAESHVTRGRAVDISSGGMGLILPHFVPRMCEAMVRVYHPTPVSTAPDGSPVYDVVFEHRVKVRRVRLEDHTPSYAIGLAFVDPEPDIEERVVELKRQVLEGLPPSKETFHA